MLRESKHIRGNVAGLKILGRGELKHGLTIEADRVSESAREKIEKAGGTVTLRERRVLTGGKRSESDEAKAEAPAPQKRLRPKPRQRNRQRRKRRPLNSGCF